MRSTLAWFEAQHEFRFPLYGAIEREGLRLELRQALEPWPVLAEESSAGGTSEARRFIGRALAGEGHRHDAFAPCRALQRPARAAGVDRHCRRGGRRRSLQGLASRVGTAPDARVRHASDFRPRRCLERFVAWRLRLSFGPSGRPRRGCFSCEFARGRGAPPRPFRGSRPYCGPNSSRHRRRRRENSP